MSIPFKEPSPSFSIDVSREKFNLTAFFTSRKAPKKESKKILLASWNIAEESWRFLDYQNRQKEEMM